ncbi:hypothetical protein Tdes44962_MAKER00079 [Teratosphaeria destructans]|uniref:Uncharacterized protein n=1 Tax=Teratosphaeria destructans TaxID=418781 RepID=A0A9W7W793_9PEZI|nr:hypothetical protein Tdes44962_MAKER00079 [Teratosphaeria destructans]
MQAFHILAALLAAFAGTTVAGVVKTDGCPNTCGSGPPGKPCTEDCTQWKGGISSGTCKGSFPVRGDESSQRPTGVSAALTIGSRHRDQPERPPR